jgi:biotin carboxylase
MTAVLVVARGAVAIRIARSCRALGLTPVPVVARSDPQRRHADPGGLDAGRASPREPGAGRAVVLGCATCDQRGYGCVDCVVRAAEAARVDAVHPGWGAIAEDPALARRLAAAGIGFVGPPANALDVAGDKAAAVEEAARIGVPVLPHATGRRAIRALGLPVVLKAPGGSQGAGVHVIRDAIALRAALAARSDWYAERHVAPARLIGVTIAVDQTGTAISLGERESLLLAGRRKLVEAAPVLDLAAELTDVMRADALRLVRALGLRALATVEFLVHADGHTFLEVNARLTGGYRTCEACTGLDLIAMQFELSRGGRVPRPGTGAAHAVQAHLYLCGDQRQWLNGVRLPPPEPGLRVDCVLDAGAPAGCDPIAGQLLATGSTRTEAGDRLARAVAATELSGLRHHGRDIVDWWLAQRTEIPVGAR